MRRLVLALAILLLWTAPAFALTLTLSGAEITVAWTEPRTNEDATPLTDLKECYVEWRYQGDTAWQAGPVKAATAPTGGGQATALLTVPIVPKMDKVVEVHVIARDLVGNISDPSVTATIHVDRLRPSPPE